MQSKLVWPVIAIICALVVSVGIYYGLKTNEQPTSDQPSSLQDGGKSNDAPGSQGITVYVTRTGKCYHRSTCRYLSKSKIPMPLAEAKRRYRACSVCNPPR